METELRVIAWLQDQLQAATPVMRAFSEIGHPNTMVVVVAICYWAISPRLGLRLGIFVLLGAFLNETLKATLQSPRPYWVDPGITPLSDTGNSFGAPSGHAQVSIAWLYLARLKGNRYVWVAAALLIAIIGFSRVFLGVHFAHQVIVGWAVGLTLFGALIWVEARLMPWFSSLGFGLQIASILALFLAMTGLGLMVHVAVSGFVVPANWSTNAMPYLQQEHPLKPLDEKAVLIAAYGLFGYLLGATLMARIGGHRAAGALWKRALRVVVGLPLVSAGFIGIDGLGNALNIGQSPGLATYLWGGLRYFALAFMVTGGAPFVFRVLRLSGVPR